MYLTANVENDNAYALFYTKKEPFKGTALSV